MRFDGPPLSFRVTGSKWCPSDYGVDFLSVLVDLRHLSPAPLAEQKGVLVIVFLNMV